MDWKTERQRDEPELIAFHDARLRIATHALLLLEDLHHSFVLGLVHL